MKTAEEYLRLKFISKGGYIKDGEVLGETKSGRRSIESRIEQLAPYMKEYAELYHAEKTKEISRANIENIINGI